MEKDRDFHFTDNDFRRIQGLVSEHTGISLSDAKKDMVYGRLSRRLRALDIEKFQDYCSLLEDEHEDELIQFTNAITTNLTSFFREPHHFEHLAKTVLPMLAKKNAHTKKIRIWSSGCSTGEEPYTIAMTVLENMSGLHGWDIKILATDLDSNVVETAKNGIYTQERVNGISKTQLNKWFRKGSGEHSEKVRVANELKNIITFKQLNLMHEWPMAGLFDIIFCRNVVIYFDKPTQKILFNRYFDLMAEEGHLFIGHSESLYRVSDKFSLIGNTIYQRKVG